MIDQDAVDVACLCRKVDVDRSRRFGIGGCVVAAASPQLVGGEAHPAAQQDIVALLAVQIIDPGAANEHIGARVADQSIYAGASDQVLDGVHAVDQDAGHEPDLCAEVRINDGRGAGIGRCVGARAAPQFVDAVR